MNHSINAAALCILTILVVSSSSPAQQLYTEDFTTNTFRHNSTTTDWNTAEGKLKLFPFRPEITGSVVPAGACRGVTIRGNIAYVAAGYSGLQVVDISDLESPAWVGTGSTQGYLRSGCGGRLRLYR